MIFTPLPRDEIAANWPWLSEMLAPAVKRDVGTTMADVYTSLVDGPDLVMVASGSAHGVLVFEITEDAVCWLKYVAGSLSGGPRARLRQMREAMAWIERKAADAGCVELRVCGRDWTMVLSNYENVPEYPNGLRKVLKMKEAA